MARLGQIWVKLNGHWRRTIPRGICQYQLTPPPQSTWFVTAPNPGEEFNTAYIQVYWNNISVYTSGSIPVADAWAVSEIEFSGAKYYRGQLRTTRPSPQNPTTYTNYIHEVCEEVLPTTTWSATPWSECTRPCEGGTQERTVTCKLNEATVDDSFCLETLGPKPPEVQECNTFDCEECRTALDKTCYYWPNPVAPTRCNFFSEAINNNLPGYVFGTIAKWDGITILNVSGSAPYYDIAGYRYTKGVERFRDSGYIFYDICRRPLE